MAVDAQTGWSTSNPWATSTTNPLVSGLTAAATPKPTVTVADPTSTESTSNPTSAARMLGTAVPEQPVSGTLSQMPVVQQTPALGMSLASLGGMQNKLTVSQGTYAGAAPTATSNTQVTQAAQTAGVKYGGPQIVAVPGPNGGGDYNYFKWDEASMGYVPMGTYNSQTKSGFTDPAKAAQLTARGMAIQDALSKLPTELGAPDPIQRQQLIAELSQNSQQLQALKFDASGLAGVSYSGIPIQGGSPDRGVSQVNQQYSQGIDAYKGSAASAQADTTAAAQANLVKDAVAYMNANGGQMNPNMVLPQSVVQAAQEAYKAQQTADGSLFNINGTAGVLPINTDTADIAGVNATNAITSQYNTNLGGADAGAMGRSSAFARAAQAGQNEITHDNAAAASFNENLAAFGNALQAQAEIDTQATGTKLNADIQRVADVAAQLEQQIQTLDAATQLRVKASIDSLQQQVNYYNQMVKQYGSNLDWVMKLGKGILAAGAAVAAVATGGAAGVALGAAAAAAGASAK